MKKLRFVCCQPTDSYYTWQVHSWLESLKQLNLSDKAIVLLYQPYNTTKPKVWDEITSIYSEATFQVYEDVSNQLGNLINLYPPIIRPFCLSNYWKDVPEMASLNIFYCDSDVLFTSAFNINSLLEDDINYLSNTNSYINVGYFDSKIKDVLPEKKEKYLQEDVVLNLCSIVGISPTMCEENLDHSGGAQYLLKNIPTSFWNKVLHDTIMMYTYLSKINKEYFENENKGIQKWCSDMWAVLYNLWYFNKKTKVVPEMDFAWATDNINKLNRVGLYHNAGITSPTTNGYNSFFKGKYSSGKNPLKDGHLQMIIDDEKSQKHCTYYYVQKLLELKDKYNLNY